MRQRQAFSRTHFCFLLVRIGSCICCLLQADKIELESELSAARNSAEELASQLRMESDAYENRIRALNDRLTEMRALCDQQERQLEAQADDVSQKQARVTL